jgi:hypothetical protein
MRKNYQSLAKHMTTLKEKKMTATLRFFQARFSTALLQSAALTIALIVLASPARAESVTLICNNEGQGGGSFTLRINYDTKIVDWLSPDGTVFLTAAATVTESAVSWFPDPSKWDSSSQKAQAFSGGLNRLSGEAGVNYVDQWRGDHHLSGPCRRATQKF